MFKLFKPKIKNSWGLHITNRHLRYIEVDGDQKNWRITRIGKINLPEGLVENGLIKDPKIFKEAIKALRSKTFPTPAKSPYVIVNLAEEHVFSRIIHTPPLTKAERDEALKWEAESNIPLPIDKVYLAWEHLKNNTSELSANPSKTNKEAVLLSATTKNILDDMMKALELAGLKPVVIESESSALVRGLSQTQSFPSTSIPILILNLREHYTHIIAFDSRVVTLSMTSEICGEKFDTAIEETFKIKREDSEKYRQRIGWNADDEFGKKLIESTSKPFGTLKKNIQSAMSFFEEKTGKKIERILLTGENLSKWKMFDRFLEKEIGIPAKWQSDWNPRIWPVNCPYVTAEREEYNIGIGLALRKLEEEI